MAIRTVVTMGFGNGTFNGSVNLLPTLGYSIGAAAAVLPSHLVARFPARTNIATFPDKTDVSRFKPKTDVAVIR